MCEQTKSEADTYLEFLVRPFLISLRSQNIFIPSQAIPNSFITNTILLSILYAIMIKGPQLISLLPQRQEITILKPSPRCPDFSKHTFSLNASQIKTLERALITVKNAMIR